MRCALLLERREILRESLLACRTVFLELNHLSTFINLRPPHHRAWQDGGTGLYLASENGHCEVVRQLLDSKADANLVDKVHLPPSFSRARGSCPTISTMAALCHIPHGAPPLLPTPAPRVRALTPLVAHGLLLLLPYSPHHSAFYSKLSTFHPA
jgi:hypothetical protein